MKKTYLLFFLLLSVSFVGSEEMSSGSGNNLFPSELTGDQLYQQGLKYMEQEKYQEALPCFEEAAKRKANFAQAYLQLGICYMNLLEVEKARQNLAFARILAPDEDSRQKADVLMKKLGQIEEQRKKKMEEKKAERQEDEGEQKKEQEAIRVLQTWGIRGWITEQGFLIQEVYQGSLAEKAGFRKDDVVVKIGDVSITHLQKILSGLQHYKSTNKADPVEVLSENKTRRISWPPIEENAITDTELKQIDSCQAAAEESLKGNKTNKAIENFNAVLSSSINYPRRSDTYVSLAKIYAPLALVYWQKNLPDVPLKKMEKPETIELARKTLRDGEQTYNLGETNFVIATRYLKSGKTEMERPGAKTTIKDFAGEVQALEKQLEEMKSRYAAARVEELNKLRENIRKADFTTWVQCSARSSWREDSQQGKMVFFRPSASVTVQNLSQDMNLEANGEVRFIDSFGKTRASVPIRIFCLPRSVRNLQAESPTGFKQEEVTQGRWKTKVFIEGREMGNFPIR